MSDFLFSEFNPVSAKQWKQKIQFDLNGADYNGALVWESNEGVKVKPFYHHDEFEQLPFINKGKNFSICQSIFISDEKIANFLAKDALQRGATSIQFEANEPFDIEIVFNSIVTQNKSKESLTIHLKLNFLSESFLSDIIDNTKDLKLKLNIDILGNFAETGNWFYNEKEDYRILEKILKKENQQTTIVSVDASLYQNAGANIVQQVAYALAHGNEYLNHFNESNVIQSDSEESLNSSKSQALIPNFDIQFHFSVGSNYFFEIAKLRAFRILWQLLLDEYELKVKAELFVQPSLRNKTLYDYNVNLLRTTTECMSAILGGADTISNISYDGLYHKKNEFGERIARNQLLILQEESYFNSNAIVETANQFADGSYYIETLTKQIAEKALILFKDIEKNGGFLKQLQAGTIQRKIEESALKEQKQFDSGEEVLLGTNKHPNLDNKMKNELELYPFVKINPRKTIIKPIQPKRLAEKVEQERLKEE